MSDPALQRALLKERRAMEKCERLKVQCRSQASLMTKLFASKLSEQGDLLRECMERGTSGELEGKLEAFTQSTSWILSEVEASGIEGATDAELESLRKENEKLLEARDAAENRYIEGGTEVTKPEPSHAEDRILDLEARFAAFV